MSLINVLRRLLPTYHDFKPAAFYVHVSEAIRVLDNIDLYTKFSDVTDQYTKIETLLFHVMMQPNVECFL